MVHLKLTKNVAFLKFCLSWTFSGGQIPDTVSHDHTRTSAQQPAAVEGEIIGNQIRFFCGVQTKTLHDDRKDESPERRGI